MACNFYLKRCLFFLKIFNLKNDVAKIEIASVIQKIAIIIDTANARIANGFIPSGGANNIRPIKIKHPEMNPIFCLRFIYFFRSNKKNV